MSKEVSELKANREAFCQAYTIHWNATRAAKESGYSEKTAAEQGYELLQNTSVKDRIAQITGHALSEIGVSRERVLSALANVAFSESEEYKPSDKLKALELLGKYLKLFTERHELSGLDGKPIETVSRSELSDLQLDEKIKSMMDSAS